MKNSLIRRKRIPLEKGIVVLFVCVRASVCANLEGKLGVQFLYFLIAGNMWIERREFLFC